MMSPSVKSSTLSGTGRGTQSGDGSKLAAGSEVGRPFASESEGKGASPSLPGMEVATGAGRHCRSIEQSVTGEKQSQSPRRASCKGQAEHSLEETSTVQLHQITNTKYIEFPEEGSGLKSSCPLIFVPDLQWLTDS